MKRFRFAKLIERLLVCLPLMFLAVSSLYVVFNPNAKDSYYAENINDSEIIYTNSLETNTEYTLYQEGTNPITDSLPYISCTMISLGTSRTNLQTYFDNNSDNIGGFRLYYSNTYQRLDFYNLNNVYLTYYTVNDSNLTITFIPRSNVVVPSDNYISYIQYNDYSFLNNVLSYSMSEFNKFGFGKIDFTSWFVNMFMNGNTNNVYVSFINSYINYFLLVECAYFVPMILYWLIHFGEDMFDKVTHRKDK